MALRSLLKRAGAVTGAATALVLVTATAASAHHCYIPMYSLQGPTSSSNWLVISAQQGAEMFGMLDPETTCEQQIDAGYSALRDAGLPVGIKLFEKMTIGEGNNLKGATEEGPTGSGQGFLHNPNGANGTGLEYFGAGSTLADDMLTTFVAGASTVTCDS